MGSVRGPPRTYVMGQPKMLPNPDISKACSDGQPNNCPASRIVGQTPCIAHLAKVECSEDA